MLSAHYISVTKHFVTVSILWRCTLFDVYVLKTLRFGTLNFWPRSFRFGSRYSQNCSLFPQKRIKCSRVPSPLRNIQQFSTVWYIYDTQISTENIYCILIKQTGQLCEATFCNMWRLRYVATSIFVFFIITYNICWKSPFLRVFLFWKL